jgi:copper chaperone NosL
MRRVCPAGTYQIRISFQKGGGNPYCAVLSEKTTEGGRFMRYISAAPGIWLFIFFLLMSTPASADAKKPVEVKQSDKCPVCGMFVARYPAWISQVIFNDGTYDVFDGPKDMFKYYFDLKKYSRSRKQSDIAAMYVTEYYSTKPMDARNVFFVLGSDVYGPMGVELVPIATLDTAKEFMRDHRGKRILKFVEVKSGDLR